MNIKCEDCTRSSVHYCMQCHKPQCYSCQRIHSQNHHDHVFRFPSDSSRKRCIIHYNKQFISYCSDCETMVCIDCVDFSHKHHILLSLSKVKDEIMKQIEREKAEIVNCLQSNRYDIDKRETKVAHFKAQLTDIVHSFPYGRTYGLGNKLFARRITWLDIETYPTQELEILFKQIKQLKAARYFYEEIQNALTRLMSTNRADEFISQFKQYKCAVEKYANTPAKCNEDTEMELLYEETSDRETKSPLIRIQIRKKGDPVAAPKKETISTEKSHLQQYEENLKAKSLLKREEEQKRHELATKLNDSAVHKQREEQLQTELRSKTVESQMLRETLQLVSVNIKNFREECERNTMESVGMRFQRPAALKNFREIENMVYDYEQCLVAVLNILHEKSRESEMHNKDRELKISNDRLTNLRDRFDQLEKENASLQKALPATKQEKDEMHLRPLVQEKDRELEVIKNRLAHFQHSYGQLENENASLKTALQGNLQEKNELIRRVQHIEEENATIMNNFEKKSRENEDLKTRLSQVAGAKLMAGNTSIADLGDKYRPTRIAELYSELYDNEWTEAVDVLVSKKWSEDMIVRHLFIILQGCYKACCQLSSQQMQDLVRKLFLDRSSADVTQFVKQHTTEIKQLIDARKAIAINVANVINKDFHKNHTFVEYLHSHGWLDEEIVYQITKQKFFEKSISLSWLMAVQDPEMYLDGDVEHRTKFDKDHYREYTKSGPLFLCSIWPALYLHKNGPLMIKGVAQACD
ncbi:myosin-3-like [Mytilus californianus]|uniref:myosin-3-like n=1 Tax=Mytilus californianus TaxID=6549 RepID=UPI00224584D4|nr:myosin-3-like [Mytilus californianus]